MGTNSILICTFSYAGGVRCTDVVCAKGLCPRHYRQQSRGRLGKTNEIDLSAEPKSITSLTLTPDCVSQIDVITQRTSESRSSCAERLIRAAISAGRAFPSQG